MSNASPTLFPLLKPTNFLSRPSFHHSLLWLLVIVQLLVCPTNCEWSRQPVASGALNVDGEQRSYIIQEAINFDTEVSDDFFSSHLGRLRPYNEFLKAEGVSEEIGTRVLAFCYSERPEEIVSALALQHVVNFEEFATSGGAMQQKAECWGKKKSYFNNHLYVLGLATSVGERGKGMATTLLNYALHGYFTRLRSQPTGHRRRGWIPPNGTTLTVNRGLVSVFRLYLRLGFRVFALLKKYWTGGEGSSRVLSGSNLTLDDKELLDLEQEMCEEAALEGENAKQNAFYTEFVYMYKEWDGEPDQDTCLTYHGISIPPSKSVASPQN